MPDYLSSPWLKTMKLSLFSMLLACMLFLAGFSGPAVAQGPAQVSVQESAQVSNPMLEKRVTALSEELRCLVCQNQTLADSHADLALDLKKQVREKLAAGMSDREVIDFMVERYGDFVLYKPPFRAATLILWAGPFVLLAFGLGILLRTTRARGSVPTDQDAATEAALQKAARLLEEGSGARS